MLKMVSQDEQAREILLQMHDGVEEDLILSNREKENFSHFEALKKPSASTNVTAHQSLIQRVPSTLFHNKDFYRYFKPRVVAIGPLYHAESGLQRAEETKLKLAVQFSNEHGVGERVLYKKIRNEIGDLKKCYSPEAFQNFEDDELAWMFFVDGCAVLQAILSKKTGSLMNNNIKIDRLEFAQLDLFMLENQLPFRVLHILMTSVNKEKEIREAIYEFIDDQIKKTIPTPTRKDKSPSQDDDINTDQLPHHLLGLLRERLLANPHKDSSSPSSKQKNTMMVGGMIQAQGGRVSNKTFRSINELKEAGIHVIPSETRSLRDVGFHAHLLGTLNIPRIVVDDSTASKFINLVAYEMCPDFDNDFGISSYLCFLDTLIDTARDVKELRHAGVLHNYMGSDEDVANLFNKVTTDLVPNLQIYGQVMDDIGKYCDKWWTPSIAKAYYTYFSTPWSIVVFLGALMGLALTAVQAYYSIRKNI